MGQYREGGVEVGTPGFLSTRLGPWEYLGLVEGEKSSGLNSNLFWDLENHSLSEDLSFLFCKKNVLGQITFQGIFEIYGSIDK